jgi:hypothetical protein
MTTRFESARRPNSYATERYPVDNDWFIEIELSKEGNKYTVWPYLGHGASLLSSKIHVEVPGRFATYWEAREAAITRIEEYLRRQDPYAALIC